MNIELISFVEPTVPFKDTAAYFQWVSSKAFESYQKQYETKDLDSGLQAAMESFNSSLI